MELEKYKEKVFLSIVESLKKYSFLATEDKDKILEELTNILRKLIEKN